MSGNRENIRNLAEKLLRSPFVSRLSIPYNCKKHVAFTLAEVLITLTVIGVVAALTIPSLLQNINDAQYRTAWQKAFSDLSAATNQINASQQDIDFTNAVTLRTSYERVLSFTKEDVSNNLFAPYYVYYKNTAGSGLDYLSTFNNVPSLMLANGIPLFFASQGNNGGNGFCTSQVGSLNGMCGHIRVDVNGLKPPNMYGKDLFLVWLVKKNGTYVIYPIGSNGDGRSCSAGSGSETTSQGCSTTSLMNGSMP